MSADLTNPIFTDEAKAREYLESERWPDGPYCPHCGETQNLVRLNGKSHRIGLHQCNECREHFTVTVGTLFERSHVPLHKWLLAMHLMSSSKKGVSAHQLHRMLGVTYKTAWFMAHRIREAMRDMPVPPIGGTGKTVEIDETFIGTDPDMPKKRYGWTHKYKVLTLVEREGRAQSYHVRSNFSMKNLGPLIAQQVPYETRVITDDAARFKGLKYEFQEHKTINHSQKIYVRGDVHTNTVEGYFSIFKRGMIGIYQHCGKQHLHRYLAEFDFRYNHRKISDAERARAAVKGITGKRLTYRRIGEGRASAETTL